MPDDFLPSFYVFPLPPPFFSSQLPPLVLPTPLAEPHAFAITSGPYHDLTIPHPGRLRCCAFSRDGRMVATACDDHRGRVFDARTGETLATLEGHSDWIRTTAFSSVRRRDGL